ncbi:fumarate lyase [Anaeromyxobacter dehalogenans 2CP-1]|uniref:Fumarate lyase n=1 Tax=Anaeromyxobacter dehalogenans (strain ATCC BAA-258 / DSM 21875 / 2CP-1) TaxID=455488 RepID=B8JGL9_ANAD2|nr:aspartate ammonia-lyase [Anaeromyxobacter dehalogenans]ACL64690.1 fumarate lyase [Anaeromyxobacter dehalogenans 2CP-1]
MARQPRARAARGARTRIERDTMGEMTVPATALYGAQTARAVENFPISGLRAHPAFVDATVRIKLAAARTNAGLGLLPRRKARAIEQVAREVLAGRHRDQFVVDVYQAGAGTSHNMNVNEVLANRAAELLGGRRGDRALVDPNDDVNMAQSTNDVVPTAIRLAALELAPEVIAALSALAGTFDAKARAWDGVVKSGRTHLMDATPIRLGQEVSGWAAALGAAAGRVRDALPELSVLGLGGTAVGTGLNADARYRARVVRELERLTGVPLTPAPNPFYAMQSLAPFVALSGALRTAALELLRIGGDVRLLGSGPNTGLGELRLPPVQPGSSIMPGKVNPSMAEMLAMVSYQVVALDGAVAWAASGGQLELNVMMPLVAFDLCHALDILARAVRAFDARCARGLEADRERARHYAERTVSLATALAPRLGYAGAAEIVKASVATGRSIVDLAIEKGGLTPAQARRALDAARLTRPGRG